MVKKILLLLASIFLIVQSHKLVWLIPQMKFDSLWFTLLIAWLVNLFVTGVFAFAGFAFPTQRLLPASYYNVRYPERLKWVYHLLRVDLFRNALLATIWRNRKQRKGFFNGRKDGIRNMEVQSMKAEFGHLIPFVILVILSVYFLTLGEVSLGVLTLFINLLGNGYPILLQRHHRLRIQRIRKRR